jgi:hypothetical protein
MADPADRRRIGKVLAGVIKKHGAHIDVDALSDELADSLIPADYLERLNRAIVDNVEEPPRPPLGTIEPTVDKMRDTALEHIANATGGTPRLSGRGNEQTYQVGNGPTIYLRTRGRDQRPGNHRVYWFGLRLACWDDPDAWFVLQCDLDFAIVVRVEDWLPYRDQIGTTQEDNQRQPHVHREGNTTELREAGGLVLNISQWVDNWGDLGQAHH